MMGEETFKVDVNNSYPDPEQFRSTVMQRITFPDGHSRWILVSLFALLMCVTIFGNVITLAAIAKFQHLQTRTYVLVASLSAADLANALSMLGFVCRGIFLMPMECQSVFLNDVLTLAELFPVALQTVHSMTIAVDRYICVVWPLRHAALLTPKVMTSIVVGAWVTSLVVILSHLIFFFGTFDQCQSRINSAYDFYTKLIISLLLTILLLGCYAKMVSISRQQKRRIEATSLPGERNSKKEHKSTVIMMVVVCSHVVMWCPYLVLFHLMMHSNRVTIAMERLKPIFVLIGFGNSGIIFFIYAWKSRELRVAYAALLGLRKRSVADMFQVSGTIAWK